jgi:hypothetical protein
MVMYIQEIGRMLAEPNWAADTAPWPALGRSSRRWRHHVVGHEGRQVGLEADRAHARPAAAVGMQKVLCRFMWLTSAPMAAGR